MKKKRETCKYCSEKMEAKTTRQEFCSDKCRVYWSRENLNHNIYGLRHPISNQVFYIGKTQRQLKNRLQGHIGDIGATTEGRGQKKVDFIKEMLSIGVKPEIFLIEKINAIGNDGVEREKFWIKKYCDDGHPITNSRHNLPTKSEKKGNINFEVKPKTLEELKKICPPELTGLDRSAWISEKRQEYGI